MPFTLTGSDVRTLRTRLGVSQVELARALGYTRQAVCRWERRTGESIPRTQYQRVLDYLNTRRDSAEAQRAAAERLRAAS